jgi:hypothetical protein
MEDIAGGFMRLSRRRRGRESLILAVTPVISAAVAWPVNAATVAPRQPLLTTNLIQVRQVHRNPVAAGAKGNIIAYPLSSPPINGFTPQVIIGMTDEWDNNDFSFSSHESSSPGSHGNVLPKFQPPPGYAPAIFDTGSSAHLITLNEWESTWDLVGASRDGTFEATLAGAGTETETVLVNDAAGIYMTGFNNATATQNGTTTTLSVAPGTLKGQYNTSVLSAEVSPPASILPNIVGSPILSQYQATIRSTRQRSLLINGETVTTPQVDLGPPATNDKIPGGYSRLVLSAQSPNGFTTPASFFPSLNNINKLGDDPISPTNWAALMAGNVSGNEDEGPFTGRSFLFDTGAQVTVLSQDTAAAAGFHLGGEDPDTPEFYVDVGGVGGVTQSVPGFYLNSLSFTTSGGTFNYTNVPVLVLNLINPATGSGYVDGILGMNLFTDRDLIINGGSFPGVAISPVFREWNRPGGGNWNDTISWSTGTVPNNQNIPAVFRGAITGPATVNVATNVTVGSLTFDSANSYTLAGAGKITLQMAPDNTSLSILGVPASIWVGSGSHTIATQVQLNTATTVEIEQPSSTLTISNDLTGGSNSLTKLGPGTLALKNIRAGNLTVNAGTLRVLQNGLQSGTSKVASLQLNGGKLDLKDNDLVVTGGQVGIYDGGYDGLTGQIVSGRNGGGWNGSSGIVTSMSAAASGNLVTLGIATASQAKGIAAGATTTWSGQTVTGSDALVMYTYGGDANLDGKLNVDDYGRIDSNMGLSTAGWYNGDFNYDGKVNVDDYGILDSNIGVQGPPLLNAADGAGGGEFSAATAVPEPAGPAILLLSISALRRGRRRRG